MKEGSDVVLEEGESFRVCIDLDGSGSDYQPGDTGYLVTKEVVPMVLGDGVNGSNESVGRRLEEAFSSDFK